MPECLVTKLNLFLVMLLPAFSLANEALFENGSPVARYSELLEQSETRPTNLSFSDGTVLHLSGYENEGNTTVIFRLSSRRVVRLAKPTAGNLRTNQNLLYAFVEAHGLLSENDVPVPKLLDFGGLNSDEQTLEYAVVERVNVLFRLDQWLVRYAQAKTTDLQLQALKAFARRLSKFSTIGDFGARQIVWTGQKWILIDWFTGNVLAHGKNDATPFMEMILEARKGHPTILNLLKKLDAEVRDARSGCEPIISGQINNLNAFGFEQELF